MSKKQKRSMICCYCDATITNELAVGHSKPPEEGDPAICGECTMVNVFDSKLSLRKPNEKERFNFSRDEKTQAIRKRVRESGSPEDDYPQCSEKEYQDSARVLKNILPAMKVALLKTLTEAEEMGAPSFSGFGCEFYLITPEGKIVTDFSYKAEDLTE